MSSCTIKRNAKGEVTNVLKPNGTESKIFKTIAKSPLVKTSEEAVTVFKNIYSKEVLKMSGLKEDELLNSEDLLVRHRVPNGDTYTSLRTALENTEENGNIELGFSINGGFLPLVTTKKSTNKDSEEGFMMVNIENGYIAEERKQVGPDFKLQAGGQTELAKEINTILVMEDAFAHLGTTGVNRAGTTLSLEKTRGKVTLENKNGELVTLDKSEVDSKTFEELDKEYDNAVDIVIQREWEKTQLPYREKEFLATEETPVRKEGELELRLLNFLAKLGVKTLSISEYTKKYKTRHGVNPSAEALADIANEVVAYTTGNVVQLSEETAHFINEALPQAAVENVLRNIHKTSEWAEFQQIYRDAYSKEYSGEALEAVIRREVLGKIVAKVLLGQSVKENATETERNIFQIVYDAVSNFFKNLTSKFKPQYQTELAQYLREVEALVANDSITNMVDTSNFKFNKFRFYSLNTANDTVSVIIRKAKHLAYVLQDVEKTLIRAGEGSKTKSAELGRVQLDLDTALKTESIGTIIANVNSAIKHIKGAVREAKSKDSSYVLSGEENVVYQSLKGVSQDLVGELTQLMTELKKQNRTSDWDQLIKESEATTLEIRALVSDVGLLDSKNVSKLVNFMLDKYNIPEANRHLVTNWIEKAESDTNLFHATFGQLVHAKDGLLNLQGSLLNDMNNYQRIRFHQHTKKYQDLLESLGITEQEIGKQFIDGQYIISEYDFNKFQAKVDEIFLSTYKETITQAIPRLEAELALNAQTGITEELTRKIGIYKDYLTKSDEELQNLINTKRLEPLNDEEATARKNLERNLLASEIERVMSDKYYDDYNKKLKEANISQVTIQTLSNITGDMSVFRKKAYKWVSGVLVLDYNSLSESDKVKKSELEKKRAALKQYVNQIGELKPGLGYKMLNGRILTDSKNQPIIEVVNPAAVTDETVIALDINKLDELLRKDNYEEKSANLFYETLNKIDREEGRDSALEFLKLNSFINLSPEFWENLKVGDSIVDKLKGLDVAPEDAGDLDSLINDIISASHQMKAIMRQFTNKGNPSEIEVEFMPEASKNTVKVLQGRLLDYLREANKLLGRAETEKSPEEIEEDKNNVSGVNQVNDSYFKIMEDLGYNEESNDSADEVLDKAMHELSFAKNHMLESNVTTMGTVVLSIKNFAEGHRVNVHSEVKKALDRLGFDQDSLTDPRVQASVIQDITRRKVLPYYRRYTSEKYTEFQEGLKTTTNLQNYLKNGKEIKEAFVEITPNYSFFDQSANSEMNPNYNKEFKGGYLQPKLSKYKNAKFEEKFGTITEVNGEKTSSKNQNLYKAYLATLEYNEDALEAMNASETHNQFTLPQVRRNTVERAVTMLRKNPIKNIKNTISDMLAYTDDDMIQGEKMFGEDAKVIPKMYINKLENPEDISTDLFTSLTMRAKEAYSREARVKYYGDLMSVYDKILNRSLKGKDAKASNTFKMAQSALDNSLFGIKETTTYPIHLAGMKFDLTKIARLIVRGIKFLFLGMNAIIPITSLLTGGVARRIEAIVGEHLDMRSQTLGEAEYFRIASKGMTEMGKVNTKAKMNVLGQFFGAFDLSDSLDNSNYGWLARILPRTGMILHTAANYPLYGKALLGVLHDFRVVEGRIMNKVSFKNLRQSQGGDMTKVDTEWKSLESKNLYKYLIHKDNTIEFDKKALSTELTKEGAPLNDEQLDAYLDDINNDVRKYVQHINSVIDGQIPETDKVLAQRHYLLSVFMTHRGWLSIAISRRFKSRHLNLETKTVEEGSYVSVWNTMGGFMREINKAGLPSTLNSIQKVWDNSNEVERRNMTRVLKEAGVLSVLMLLSYGLMGLADDDDNKDNFALQLLNYAVYRTVSETSSTQLNIGSNLFEAIESPIVGWSTLKTVMSVSDLLNDDVIESGNYKGMTKRERYLTKFTPGAKQYFDMSNLNQTFNTYKFYNDRNLSGVPVHFIMENLEEE